MQTIWKFGLSVTDYQEVAMPIDAEILCVQVQNGVPCIWAKVHSDNPRGNRRFAVYGTGYELVAPRGMQKSYLGTIQLHEGALVFHVYELTS